MRFVARVLFAYCCRSCIAHDAAYFERIRVSFFRVMKDRVIVKGIIVIAIPRRDVYCTIVELGGDSTPSIFSSANLRQCANVKGRNDKEITNKVVLAVTRSTVARVSGHTSPSLALEPARA